MAADTSPPEYLFVYGTLLSWTTHPMGQVLRAGAELIGPASLRGRLYLAGLPESPGGTERPSSYPACVPSDDPGDAVHGELYAVRDTGVLKALDAYEECGPGFPEPWEYVRVPLPVESPDRAPVRAWVYLYNHPVDGLEHIPEGRWSDAGH